MSLTLDPERQAHFHRLRAIHRANLDKLEEQKAQFGLNVPIELHSAIAHEQKAIETLDLMIASTVPTSLTSEVGTEGLMLALLKQLDRQDAAFRTREQLDFETRSARQHRVDLLLYILIGLVITDLVLRFL